MLEIDRWLGCVSRGADQPQLFAGPKTENHAALKFLRMRLPPLGQMRRQFKQSRDTGGIVVCPVVDHPLLSFDAESSSFAATEMIIMRAEHDIFRRRVGRHLSGRREQSDDVAVLFSDPFDVCFDVQHDSRQGQSVDCVRVFLVE